ncbi:pilus (MSHA type) biogenesis protein MshL [Oceanisphaera arctica]|uniref:Pilus (MSHA type) biogenesis protein MshL n=1 Tax=Oceanisphaera arctica TaxID=641510 RepID=A0A2P5TR56_9GAMM|nr:pilus (MSHA type) biogenesis protein MshL [Oceanisphaera arctica]PPL18293.1 pilus (MSHA type) biogenesis protein MshL [Oceanisphaera arctica]GHA12129.1 pilus (MSHA type) biogenesis protein MshL [Oceanisphaera arctica]
MTPVLRQPVILLLSTLLVACVSAPDGSLPKDSLEEAMRYRPDPLPAAVERELLGGQARKVPPALSPRQRRFDIAASEVDARAFFAALGAEQDISIAVHPEVNGSISLNLRQVTLPEVLDAISGLYGYGVQQKGNIYQVFPSGVRTRTFNVNYLMLSREGLSQTAISGSSLSGHENGSDNSGTRINTKANSDFWQDLESALSRLLGDKEGRVVVTNPQAGLVSVRAAPAELALVEDFLTRAERQLKRQVVLEARIIEVELSDGYQQGIEWSQLTAGSTASRAPAPLVTGNSGAGSFALNPLAGLAGGGVVFNVTDGNFNAVISLLQTQGEVNTLSNPRVTASNNQKAVIKVGTDEYFVTDFSVTTTTGTSTTTTPEVELTPFFSGISLDVTPQIADDNRILMHVHPSVSQVEDSTKTISFGSDTISLPLARSSIRESDTVVEARSGELIIIGGLMQETQSEQNAGVPLLSEIPVLGNLFKNRKLATKKSELVIMLRPVVVNENTWQTELQRSRDLLEKWYPPLPPPLTNIHSGAL